MTLYQAHVSPETRSSATSSPSLWTATRREQAQRVAVALLAGRGEGEDIWTDGHHVLHLRRRLTATERELLPAGWMSIPPIDMG